MHVRSLLATIMVVGVIDGGLLLVCIAFAETTGRGVMYFVAGGGPPTLLYAGSLYAWLKKRLAPAREARDSVARDAARPRE
jgi:hypothetical protein